MRTMTGALIAMSLGIAMLAAACDPGPARFPVCETDADCQVEGKQTAGPLCYDLRCVECRYDSDCDVGSSCNLQTKECQSLGGGGPSANEDGGEAGDDEGWEDASWEACAADCKDESCIAKCEAKFGQKEP